MLQPLEESPGEENIQHNLLKNNPKHVFAQE